MILRPSVPVLSVMVVAANIYFSDLRGSCNGWNVL